jgi:two-component system cell cycle response regulator
MSFNHSTPNNSEQILIVEDSMTQALRLHYILEQQNFHVAVVANAAEALSFIRAQSPAVIVSDIMMPDMDGYELCKRIKAERETKDIPIILLTALSEPEDILKALDCDADSFILKPYEDSFIISTIRSILANKELNKYTHATIGVEIVYSGKKHFISMDRIQILDNLIASLERAVHRNVELKQQNQALENALKTIRVLETNHRAMLDNNGDGMIVVSPEGIVRYVNPAAQKLFKESASALIGQSFQFPLEVGKIQEIHIGYTMTDHTVAEIRVIQMEWEGESAYLVTLHDITDRKKALEELENARRQQMEIKNKFLSHVSHELRTPLTAIYQFNTIMLDGLAGEINHEQEKFLRIMLKNVKQLVGMIDDLIEVTRFESEELTIAPEIIRLEDLIDESLETLRNTASDNSISLDAAISYDLPFVFADPKRIRQVIINLIDNGIKFSPKNTTIHMSAEVFEKDPAFLCVSVADQGSGIVVEDRERIFEYLYQGKDKTESKSKGLGLGLYICREIISKHGGSIWVESEYGKGSVFYFTLPIFSLSRELEPIFALERIPESVISLILVEALTKTKCRAAKPEKNALAELYGILKNCIAHQPAVLLSRMGDIKCGEIFFIVAFADQNSCETLSQQIQNASATSADVSKFLDLEISYSIVDDSCSIDKNNLVDEVLLCIEDIIQATLYNRRALYDSEKNSYRRR